MKFTIVVDINHKIYLLEDLIGETFGWNLDVEMFNTVSAKKAEDFREQLITMGVGIIDLNYLDKSNNNQSELGEINIIVWNFNDSHFDWLIKEEPGKIKFVAIYYKK